MKDADRELIELAAKAYGIQVKGWLNDKLIGFDTNTEQPVNGDFNPLESDGDALRLLVKISQRDGGAALMLNSRFNQHHFAQCHTDANTISPSEHMTESPSAATRRVITRTAAEIGRGANKLRQAKGDGMNPKDFFSKYGREQIEIGCPWVTVEEMYQAFKARMMDELCVNLKQAGKVEDDDGHSYFVDGELVDKE